MTRASHPEIPQTLAQDDIWLPATWDEYCQYLAAPEYERAKGYYYKGYMRLEMAPVSPDHAEGDHVMALAVNLFSIARNVALKILSNCSYQSPGLGGFQPDISVYFGAQVQGIPFGASLIDLEQYPPPALVIEIAKSSVLDDLGIKRSLYESLGVQEYWIVDMTTLTITAYQMVNQGSYCVSESQVLPGLSIHLLEVALQQSRISDHRSVGAWLLSQFQR